MATGTSERAALTERQQQAFNVIKDGGDAKAIAEALGIAVTGAHSHIKALQKKGYVDKSLNIVGLPSNGASKPKAARPKPSTPVAAAVNGTAGNTGNESVIFALDEHVQRAVASQTADLKSTVQQVDNAVKAHSERIGEINAEIDKLNEERSEHEMSITGLNARRDSLEDALRALGESPETD